MKRLKGENCWWRVGCRVRSSLAVSQSRMGSKFRRCSVNAQVRPRCAPFTTEVFQQTNTTYVHSSFSTRYRGPRIPIRMNISEHNTTLRLSRLSPSPPSLLAICISGRMGQSHLTEDRQSQTPRGRSYGFLTGEHTGKIQNA